MKTMLLAVGGNSLIRAGEKGTIAESMSTPPPKAMAKALSETLEPSVPLPLQEHTCGSEKFWHPHFYLQSEAFA